MITLNYDEVLERTYNAKKGAEVRYGLGQGFEYCKQFADEAQGYATAAKASEKKATDAVAGIEQTKTDAVQAVQNAQTTATNAVQQAQSTATSAVTTKQTEAVQAIGTAQAGAVKAVDDERDDALQQVADSTKAAQTAASNASTAANAAGRAATAAGGYASNAESSATAASGSASAAATSESNAATSAQSSKTDADRAEAAAELAGTRANTDKELKTENAPADAAATGEALAKKADKDVIYDSEGNVIFYSKAAVDELLAGKLDLTGGDMQGWIDFGNRLRGLKWTVGNGDYYTVVSKPNSNLFQIVRQPHNGTIYAPLNITENGQIIMYTGGSGWFTIDDQQVATIVASGSNYVRFGDGTQICWASYTQLIASSGASTWTFPLAFSALPAVVFQAVGNDAACFDIVGGAGTATTHATFFPWRGGVNSYAPYGVDVIAIGRWK